MKFSVRHYLPITVPLSVGSLLNFAILLRSEHLLRIGLCHVGSPLTPELARALIAFGHPSTLREVEELARHSTQCVANLHLEIAAAYVVAFIVSLIAGICALPFVRYVRLDVAFRDDESKKLNIRALCIGAAFFALVTIEVLYAHPLINFDYTQHKFSTFYDGYYINTSEYFILIQAISFMGWMSFWFGVVGEANFKDFYGIHRGIR